MSEPQPYLSIVVHSVAASPQGWPVDVSLDASLLAAVGCADVDVSARAMRLVEVAEADSSGLRLTQFQLDKAGGDAAVLTFLLSDDTPAASMRTFRLYRDGAEDTRDSLAPLVRVTDGVVHEEQESFRIDTPAATYLYHKLGAGFASIIDADGADWLSYHPWGGSDGKFRGIPNLAYPESMFHPGNTDSTSRILAAGPVKATIQSESEDGEWACQWDIYAGFARLTVLRAGHPYWFLYEGTPGGWLDEAGDYVVRAPGVRTSAAERWDERLPAPRWVYFGTVGSNRVLYLVHHEDDGETDSYWPMEQNMTVFGFGRLGLASSLTETPARFTVGFADASAASGNESEVAAAIQSVCEPPVVAVEICR